jgi:hypothetical protein
LKELLENFNKPEYTAKAPHKPLDIPTAEEYHHFLITEEMPRKMSFSFAHHILIIHFIIIVYLARPSITLLNTQTGAPKPRGKI